MEYCDVEVYYDEQFGDIIVECEYIYAVDVEDWDDAITIVSVALDGDIRNASLVDSNCYRYSAEKWMD